MGNARGWAEILQYCKTRPTATMQNHNEPSNPGNKIKGYPLNNVLII